MASPNYKAMQTGMCVWVILHWILFHYDYSEICGNCIPDFLSD